MEIKSVQSLHIYHLYKVLVISVNFDINQTYYLELALILSQHDLVRCYKVVNIKEFCRFYRKNSSRGRGILVKYTVLLCYTILFLLPNSL